MKKLLILPLLGLLGACTTVEYIQVPKQPNPSEVQMLPVKFITENDLICLSDENFTNLAQNLNNILRYSRDQQALIEYYETFTETFD